MKGVSKPNRALIISLIEQDLIYFRFICSLDSIRLIADDFVLDIDKIILKQAGIEDHPSIDEIYDEYMQRLKKVMELPLEQVKDKVPELAAEIWNYLEGFRKQ